MLLASSTVLPASWPCILDKAKTIKVDRGSETIKPPKIGLVFETHKTSVNIDEVKNKFKSIAVISKDPFMKKVALTKATVKKTKTKVPKPKSKGASSVELKTKADEKIASKIAGLKEKISKSRVSKSKALNFTKDTFRYFDLAKRNKFKKEWFEKNKDLYEESVKAPMAYFLLKIKQELGNDLKRILVDPKKITRPLRPSNKAKDLGWLKDHSHFTLWESKTSIFEWNPAIHFQVGAKPDDNLLGVGLYMVSGRQIHRFRQAAVEDYVVLDEITEDKKFKSRWGTDFGEKYKRFPKGYDQNHPAAQYLWCKQFFVGREFTREQITSSQFTSTAVKDLKLAMPFFSWVRHAVGTYQRNLEA